MARVLTRCRTWRSSPVRSPEPGTPAPRDVSTTSSCSTYRPGGFRPRKRGAWSCGASSPRSSPGSVSRRSRPGCSPRSRTSSPSPSPDLVVRHFLPGAVDPMSTLEIKNLHVQVDTAEGVKEILRGVDLTIRPGETHAVMGPNGSGKSTLAYSIAGHPKYTVTSGSITLDGADVLAMSVDERARAGLFLAMQYPVEVPGVSVSNFLRTAVTAARGEAPKLRLWVKEMRTAMTALSMDPTFAERNVNEGFSGGEKKRHEILQLE